MADFETVIGLEVHVEMATVSKLFCGCPTKFGAPPNTHVCPVCLGLPGVLPVLNRQALEWAVMTGLALGCTISPRFKFDRKHYYYPDLPKNFQISQYDIPFARDGHLDLASGRKVRIHRVHLEEDAGKLIHEGTAGQIGGGTAALVDYNRTGIPLMEIVSEPDLRQPAEAAEYLREIQRIVRYLRVSDGNMEEGSLRCDANISLRPVGEAKLGAKVEIKNMNSFRGVERALEHEEIRQKELLLAGKVPAMETRLFNEETGETRSMRGKEGAHDYRYFPEPDLLPFTMSPDRLEKIRKGIPELPAERNRKLLAPPYSLSEYDAQVLTSDRAVGDYFEAVVAGGVAAKSACNWVTTELLGALKAAGQGIGDSRITPGEMSSLLRLIGDGTISGKIAKTVFAEMFKTGKKAADIVREQGLTQIADEGALRTDIEKIVAANPRSIADFKAGKQQALGFLIGQVMKATQGKANPGLANKLVKEILEKS